MSNHPLVMLVDDEFDIRHSFGFCLEKNIGKNLIETKTTASGKEAAQIITQNNRRGIKTLVFVDVFLKDINGDKIVEILDLNPINTRGILISAHQSLQELEEIKKKSHWVTNYYEKPITDEIIIREVSKFLNQSELSKFNYNNIDGDTVDLLKNETNKIKSLIRKTADNIIQIGGSLRRVKQKLEHGKFTYWIESELGMDYGSALNFMRVWETFRDNREEIAKFGLNVSILYLLSAKNTPQELRDEVFRRAEAGNPLSFAETKQLKKEFLERSEIQQQSSTIRTNLPTEETITTIDVKSSPDITPSTNKTQQQLSKFSRVSKNNSSIKTQPSQTEPNQNQPTTQKVLKIIAPPTTTSQNVSSKILLKENQQQTIKVIRQQKIWQLKNHILYCGLPNSEEFRNLLPSSISVSLNIGFPNFSDWTQENLFPIKAKTTTVHHTLFSEINVNFLLMTAKNSIEYFTEGGEIIVLAFLPIPDLLVLADRLESRSFIAEPDPKKCQTAISRWRQYQTDGIFPFLDAQNDLSDNTDI